MAYLKPDSVPALQEMRIRKACQIIQGKSEKEDLAKNRKSYVIDSKFFGDDESLELGFPFNKPFGRG